MRRLLPTAVAVLGLSMTLVACVPRSEPAQNGRLPDSALTTVTASCQAANHVGDPLRDLMAAASAEGIALQPETRAYDIDPLPGPPRIEACYRSFEIQQWWRDFYCYFLSCAYAAVPGTSIHGWGRAVDFEDGAGPLTFGSAGYRWMQANAARFGFFHPSWAEPGSSSPEPWHWEHA
jgi:D-alanyl-D-alanine carboxypeptidase